MFLDKIRIILVAPPETALGGFSDDMLYQLNKIGYDLKEHYSSSKMNAWATNYVFKWREEGTLFIGFRRNAYKEQAEGVRLICVEYNPNKTEFPLILQRFFCICKYKYHSVSYTDVAFDFECSPADIRIITNKSTMSIGIPSNLSRYISPDKSHLRIKVYDKTKERKKFNIDLGKQVTRVEISIKNPTFHESPFLLGSNYDYLNQISAALSDVYILSFVPLQREQLIQKYGKYDPGILYLLENSNEEQRNTYFSLVSPNTAVKYRAWFKCGTHEPLKIDLDEFHKKISLQINNCISDVCTLRTFV